MTFKSVKLWAVNVLGSWLSGRLEPLLARGLCWCSDVFDAGGECCVELVVGRSSVSTAVDGSSSCEWRTRLRNTESVLPPSVPRPLSSGLRNETPQRQPHVCLPVGRHVDHRRTVARLLLYVLLVRFAPATRQFWSVAIVGQIADVPSRQCQCQSIIFSVA